jgi:5-methylcytosine-specific restriction endonuclease McrA
MVPQQTRKLIQKRAKYLCEYCHSPEYLSPDGFTLDHIMPRSLDGSDESENLCLCCTRCNGRHYNFTTGNDPQTGHEVKLFNPRTQQWAEHFIWSVDGQRIVGKTAVGRATCGGTHPARNRLDLNDDRHNDGFILKARQFWIRGGWHPPTDDPRENR